MYNGPPNIHLLAEGGEITPVRWSVAILLQKAGVGDEKTS